MTQPLTPQQQAAALWQQQQAAIAAQAAATQAPPPPVAPPQPGLLERGWNAIKAANNAAGNAILHPIDTNNAIGNAILGANRSAGQAVLNAVAPTPDVTPPPPASATRLTTPGSPGAQAGSTAMQGQPDPLAALMRPQGGGAAHAVGYSPADKAMLTAADQSQDVDARNTQSAVDAVTANAKSSQAQSEALAANSQQGLAEYQQHLQDNDAHRQQLNTDAIAAQRRIEGKLADMEASGIDPNRYFQDQSTGQKILGGLAIGLGTFAAHALGPNGHDSTNTALDIINGAIARDVDAQRTNMQKSLSVMSSRMNLNAQGFDQQKALLEAERESIQSGYAVALNETAKRAAMVKDNADVQMNAAKISAGLKDTLNTKIDDKNKEIYQIAKGAERVVGGGGTKFDPAKVAEVSGKWIQDEAAAGRSRSIPEGRAYAMDQLYGLQSPGVDTSSTGKAAKGGAQATARLGKPLANMEANADELDKLKSLLSHNKYLNPSQQSTANQMLADLAEAGVKIPGLEKGVGPLDAGRVFTSSQVAAIEAAKGSQTGRVGKLKDVIKNGAVGGPDEDNPAGLDEEDEEK